MTRPSERWAFVIVFLLLVLFTAYQEYELPRTKFDWASAIWLLFSGLVLAGPGKTFLKIISRMFLDLGLTTNRLHELSSERSRIVAKAQGPQRDEYADTAALVENTLKFAESWLDGWVKGSHFELSVFVDKEKPLIFAYFDSNKDSNFRSANDRRKNPRYYRDAEYEVIKLLDTPTSVPYIVPDTTNSPYVFVTKNQKKQIGSTIILYADVSVPCVLVVTSDKKKAFRDKDKEMILFLKYVAETVYYDIRQNNFSSRIRALRPELFTR